MGQLEARGGCVVGKKWAMLESGLDLLDDAAPDECSHWIIHWTYRRRHPLHQWKKRRKVSTISLVCFRGCSTVPSPPPHNIVSVRGSENHTTELHENVGEDFRVSGSSDYDLETHGLPPPIHSALSRCAYQDVCGSFLHPLFHSGFGKRVDRWHGTHSGHQVGGGVCEERFKEPRHPEDSMPETHGWLCLRSWGGLPVIQSLHEEAP